MKSVNLFYDFGGIIMSFKYNLTDRWRQAKSCRNMKKPQVQLKNLRLLEGMIGWSWRDSNPRPHKETIRFLHAYSSLRFSRCDKTWTTNHTLIL